MSVRIDGHLQSSLFLCRDRVRLHDGDTHGVRILRGNTCCDWLKLLFVGFRYQKLSSESGRFYWVSLGSLEKHGEVAHHESKQAILNALRTAMRLSEFVEGTKAILAPAKSDDVDFIESDSVSLVLEDDESLQADLSKEPQCDTEIISSPEPSCSTSPVPLSLLDIKPIVLKPKFHTVIPNHPLLLELDQLTPEQKAILEKAQAKAVADKQDLYVEDPLLPRPVFVSKTGDVFLCFDQQGAGDRLIGFGMAKKVYYAVNLQTGKVRIQYSIKRDQFDLTGSLREYQIGEVTGQGPKLFGFAEKMSKGSTKSHTRRMESRRTDVVRGVKDVVIVERFSRSLFAELLSNRIDFTNKQIRHEVFLQIAREVATFNEGGYIHRDIKPENFLVKWKKGRVMIKIADFGSAHPFGPTLTMPGSRIYFSPEAWRESMIRIQPYTYSTLQHDAWALGILLFIVFDAFSVNLTFTRGRTLSTVFHKMRLEGDASVTRFYEDYMLKHTEPEWIAPVSDPNTHEYVVRNLLSLDPAKRWTAAQAVAHLEAISPYYC